MKGKLGYLEGLRGLAALVVLFNHLRHTFSEFFTDNLLVRLKESTNSYLISHVVHSLVNVVFDGKLAVYIFWFMSAYVISIKLFHGNDDQYLFKGFSKRYFRLMLPALASVMFAYLLLAGGLMHNLQVAQRLGETYQNGWLGHHYNFEPSFIEALRSVLWNTFFDWEHSVTYNSNLWTMNPELYGSIFCFFLFGVIGQNKYRYIIYAVIIGGASLLAKYWLISFLIGFLVCDIDYSHPSRVKEFVDFATSNKFINTIVLVGAIMVAGKLYSLESAPLIMSSLIVLSIMRTKYLQDLLQRKLFVWLGKISFSLYLIHIPIICSFSCYLYLTLDLGHREKVIVVSLLTIILTILISYVFEKYIDRYSVLITNKFASFLVRSELK